MKKKLEQPSIFEQLNDIFKPDVIPTIPTFDQLVSTELTKFDVVVPKVAELSAEFMPLKITSIEDKDSYNEVSKALRFIVSKRTAVEEKRKELKADSLAFGRAVDARAKEITLMLSPIEDHLKNEKQRIDDEIENLKRIEQEAKDKFINDRILRLLSIGFAQTMTEFIWYSKLNVSNTESFLKINIELWSDEDFYEFTSRIEQINKTEKETLIFQDELRKAQEERIREERQKLEEEQNKLKAETDKLWEEMDKIKNDRTQFRNSVLTNLGLGVLSFNNYWLYFKRKNVYNNVSIILREEVENFSNEEWQNALVSIDTRIEELKRQDQIDEEVDKRKILDEQKSEQIDIEEVAEEKLNIFISNLSDKEKFEVYVASLLDITEPEMKTKKYQGFVTGLVKSISSFKNMS
jgi:hypothetical protein